MPRRCLAAVATAIVAGPKGTQFDTLTGSFQLADGKLLFSDMNTATGNLSIRCPGQQLELAAAAL